MRISRTVADSAATFEPIAVVGRACILPGANDPDALWAAVHAGRDLVGPAPADRWGLAPRHALSSDPGRSDDRTWSDRGGYVHGFEGAFAEELARDPFPGVPSEQLIGLDPLFGLVLHTGRRALREAGIERGTPRMGAVMGNLSFPSSLMSRYAESVWFADAPVPGRVPVDPRNRFMSGLPAHLLAKALGLGDSLALDAACASSLYAIKLACDRLHDRTADLMLAGAVCRSDDLFIHIGFCALRAMSRTGRSRPFHRDADGLVPAEGAAMLALKRLSDAVAAGDRIYGVIRGVGLSNDGRGRGFLAPSSEGQVRAMRAAYAQSGLSPLDVQLAECHATGTSVGDATEVHSMAEVFAGHSDLPIGSLKSNMGHLITAAGAAGLLKVMSAMEHGVRPPTLHADALNPALDGTPLRVLQGAEPWEGRRLASVSAFGFGGNNAHLLVEAWEGTGRAAFPVASPPPGGEIAIVRMGAAVADGTCLAEFADDVFSGADKVATGRTAADKVRLPLKGLRFPPTDLEQTLAQQTLGLQTALEAVHGLELPRERTLVLFGMGADPEVARYGARWRLRGWAEAWDVDERWVEQAADAVVPLLRSAGVVGTMPNIPANRINSQHDLAGPSFTVSAEERSGVEALRLAVRALRAGEADAAVVGASDLSCEPVHAAAVRAMGDRRPPGDAAVVFVLKRLEDARRDGDTVYAVVADDLPEALPFPDLSPRLGHAHAASALVQVAAAALSVHQGRLPGGSDWPASARRAARVEISCSSAPATHLVVAAPADLPPDAPLNRDLPRPPQGPTLELPAHPPAVRLPALPEADAQPMAAAPPLPPANEDPESIWQGRTGFEADAPPPGALGAPPAPRPAPVTPAAVPAQTAVPAALAAAPMAAPPLPSAPAHGSAPLHPYTAVQAEITRLHQTYVEQQAALHRRFLEMRSRALQGLVAARAGTGFLPPLAAYAGPPPQAAPVAAPARVATPVAAAPTPVAAPPPKPVTPVPVRTAPAAPASKPVAPPKPATAPKPVAPPKPATAPKPTPTPKPAAADDIVHTPPPEQLPGPKFDRAQLEILASDKISKVFGPLFARQDDFPRQVRMPTPPLLFADRVTGIDAEPGSMTTGTIWTETDIREDSWYLHDGVMPAGVMIEAGQADLLLISWLGADFLNRGERVYRLLGCELTYSGGLPRPGDTLQYDIHVDGHATTGGTRIFFFHSDTRVDGRKRLQVRNGQAGFFTDDELANSGGILWKPETGERVEDPRLDPPRIACTRTSFEREHIEAFSQGDAHACFGPGFEILQAHVRTPRISPAPMLFMDRVTHCAPGTGPWGRGYLRAEQDIAPDDWFFEGHFKDDPCMPGTMMFEGCLQALAFYMTSLGFTVNKDGWRFEPVPDVPYQLRCRGQVTPQSKQLVYEIFIEEVVDGDRPTIWADFLCTVDGLKAFHARRVGLHLVPDWPITTKPEVLRDYVETKEIATVDGFEFGYPSLIACAWGKPSDAFGPMYAPFDEGRHCARLPGPPYHFMTRVVRIDGDIGAMQIGTEIELEYDVPPDAWYFDENGCRSMPFCVLLEAALQPCGWIASYVGSALTTTEDLFFRNLDGTATWTGEIFPQSGTLRTVARITNISRAGGMIVESFDVDCFVGETKIYTMQTVFGFFPRQALANQIGITPTAEERAALLAPSDFQVDLTTRPERYCAGPLRLPGEMLLMLDRIRSYWPQGGKKGLGRIVAEKDVDPNEWFFKAHFYSDPVQPGSLGIEAMIQLLQFWMIHENLHEGMDSPRFEPLSMGDALTWKYRGQVVPKNEVIRTELDITEVRREDGAVVAVADAWLWVDELRIYQATGLAIRIVDGGIPDEDDHEEADEELLDPAEQSWLADHCPTWTLPALPAMSMLDRLAGAVVKRTDEPLVGVEGLQIHRWLVLDRPTRIRVELGEPTEVDGLRHWPAELQVWREARQAALSRFEPVATGTVLTGTRTAPPALLAAPEDAETVPDPYASGRLFHGPAFRMLTQLALGSGGAVATLDAGAGGVPRGTLGQGLLDALTHAVPHDAMHRWSDAVPEDRAAYPWRVESFRLWEALPQEGELTVVARFEGFADEARRHPVTLLQARVGERVVAELRLAEVLVPKGPVGMAEPARRAAFLRDHAFADGLGLSVRDGDATVLGLDSLRESDWLPGTVAAAWDTRGEVAEEVAIKEHVARELELHPRRISVLSSDSAVPRTQPLTRFPVEVTRSDTTVRVRDAGAPQLDIEPVRRHWDAWFDIGRWPVEDLYYGLIERFVHRVHLADPEAFEAVRGRSLLYLGNHQVGVESLLFSILASGLSGVNTVTLAKIEHKTTWLGKLIAHSFGWPGARDPGVITFFDRSDKASLPGVVGELAAEMVGPGKSVMVHIEGTRSLQCRTPVKLMSSIFIDMALKTGSPIVPIRFVGGLPTDPLKKRLEFPLGMGRQDIWLGKPLMPEEIAALPLRERKEVVIGAINALGPPNSIEEPLPGDPDFASRVDAWVEQSGASHEHATLLRVLQERPDLCEASRRLLDGVGGVLQVSDDAEGRWLAEMARRLYGPRGGEVRIG